MRDPQNRNFIITDTLNFTILYSAIASLCKLGEVI